jgi:chemotaxis protein methyltransferase CheR
VNENVRERVTIEVLNLALDHYPSLATGTWGMDLILCRNVFIYFDREATRRAGQRLLDALAEGGWLITGASDPPLAVRPPYEVVTNAAGAFYRRGEGQGPAAKRVRESPERDSPYPPLYEEGEKNGWPLAGGLPALADQIEAGGTELAGPPSELTAAGPRSSIGGAATPSQTCDPLAAAREAFAKGDYGTVLDFAGPRSADPEAAALRIRALANLRDAAEARRAAAEATARHPLSTELRFLYAVLLLGLGDDAAAAREMRHALYLDRSLALCHFTLASILRRGGDLAGAGRAYRNARALLAACPPQQIVPLADGERAGRLLEAAEAQLVLLESVPEESL